MQITKSSIATMIPSTDWFTGSVFVDTFAVPSEGSRVSGHNVHFAPGARSAWHTHPNGQTLLITEGVGLCQRRGGPIEMVRPGDSVFFEPGEEHWHGASPDRFMVHVAVNQVDAEGASVVWGEHVTDEEYGQQLG